MTGSHLPALLGTFGKSEYNHQFKTNDLNLGKVRGKSKSQKPSSKFPKTVLKKSP